VSVDGERITWTHVWNKRKGTPPKVVVSVAKEELKDITQTEADILFEIARKTSKKKMEKKLEKSPGTLDVVIHLVKKKIDV